MAELNGLAVWRHSYEQFEIEWSALEASRRFVTSDLLETWERRLRQMAVLQFNLVSTGRWVSGPADLLGIAGIESNELIHSAVVAWFVTPTAPHGLGTSVLHRILDAGWPELPIADLTGVVVEREVVVEDRRADVVVTAGDLVLVIENKVFARESPDQCEDLYRLWNGRASDVRFLLLSPTGRPPRSTSSGIAATAWRSISYPGFATLVESCVAEATLSARANHTIRDYLATLQRMFGVSTHWQIGLGGGHVSGSD